MISTNGNGAAAPVKPTNGVKTTLDIKPPAKPNALAVVPKVADHLPPLEDRLHRINQLFEIQSKYNRLQSSLTKLNEFELDKQGERNRLSLMDEHRSEFSTNNPEIIAEVKDFLKAKIKEKIKALEPQLKW